MRIRRLITAFTLAVISGCSTVPRSAPAPATATPSVATQVSEREALAMRLLAKHSLAEALVQWNILSTIDPRNATYRKQILALQKMINEEAGHHYAAGLANLRAGQDDAARLHFLKVLALDPRRRDALSYLREIDERQAKSKPDNGTSEPAYSKSDDRTDVRLR